MIQDKRAKGLAIVLIISVLGIILMSSFATAGFFDYLKNKLTGKATTQSFQVNLSIGNTAPLIPFLEKNHTGTEYVVESNGILVEYVVLIDDADGVDNLDVATLELNYTNGTFTRSNTTCLNTQNNSATRMNFTCSFNVNYWETGSSWGVNASIEDLSGTSADNDTEAFTLGETTAFTIDQSQLTFPSPTPGQAAVETTGDPSLILNNTANDPIETGKIYVNATDLPGAADGGYRIYGSNFSVHWGGVGGSIAECTAGSNMTSGANITVTGANLTTGDQSAGNGYEDMWVCLKNVSSSLISQDYSTQSPTADGPWALHITQ